MVSFPTVLDDLMMAQQPIIDRKKHTFGYELLFRGKNALFADFLEGDGDAATSQVLVNLCIGITELGSQFNKPFFINITADLMMSDAFLPITPNTVYIEILENQKITPEFVKAVKKWHKIGYRFVLDDYQFTDDYNHILPFVSIIKVDVLATPPDAYRQQIAQLKAKGLILLAEKVESLLMLEQCMSFGFDLFQGYFLQRPEVIKGRKIDSATHSAIELVNALQDDRVSIDTVTNLVSINPKLSYQLLRILNSPLCGIAKTVTSIKEAIVLLGLSQLKKWALLITLTSSNKQPKALLKILLTRARCCQLLAIHDLPSVADSAFMVGLMSGIDAVFHMEKRAVLAQIALDKPSRDAILSYSGQLGGYLQQTMNFEEQNWQSIQAMPLAQRNALNRAFLEAITWSENVMLSIN